VKLPTNVGGEELRKARFTVTLKEGNSVSTNGLRPRKTRIVRITAPPVSATASSSPDPLPIDSNINTNPSLTSTSSTSSTVASSLTEISSNSSQVSEPTNISLTIPAISSHPSPSFDSDNISSPRSSLIQERCTFWPICTKGENCPYYHPKETCKYWPNCSYGIKCLNIHPLVPCKFGTTCMNPHCEFSHPSAILSQTARGRGGRGRWRGKGRRGARGGARGRGGGTNGGQRRKRGRNETISLGNETKKCRFGTTCKKDGCKLKHPVPPVLQNRLISPGTVLCHWDPACTSITCIYAHPKRDIQEQEFLKTDISSQQETNQEGFNVNS